MNVLIISDVSLDFGDVEPCDQDQGIIDRTGQLMNMIAFVSTNETNAHQRQ